MCVNTQSSRELVLEKTERTRTRTRNRRSGQGDKEEEEEEEAGEIIVSPRHFLDRRSSSFIQE